MKRESFLKVGCACAAALLGGSQAKAEDVDTSKSKQAPSIRMNESQVKDLIHFIDATQSNEVKESVFRQLGKSCFSSRNLDQWIGQYKDNPQILLDWVNIEKKSRFWEKLEFNEDRSTLTLIGRPSSAGCACAYADQPEPPLSLCNICCKNFQEALFGNLLSQPVRVEITSSHLLGNNRCNTVIHLL